MPNKTTTKQASPIVRLTWETGDGTRTVDCDIAAIGPREAMAVRRETGIPWMQWLLTFENIETADVDSIAVLLWVARLRSGEQVTLDHVMEGLDYTSNITIERVDAQDSPAGEASAGN